MTCIGIINYKCASCVARLGKMYSYAIQKTRRPCRAHLTRALELEPLSAVNTGHLDISVTEGKLSSQLNSSICRQSA